jgi:hypothetical protein
VEAFTEALFDHLMREHLFENGQLKDLAIPAFAPFKEAIISYRPLIMSSWKGLEGEDALKIQAAVSKAIENIWIKTGKQFDGGFIRFFLKFF